MKVEFPQVLKSISSQPTTPLIAADDLARVELVITMSLGGPFYIKRGEVASASNWDFMLVNTGDVVVTNFTGNVYCYPTPTAGQINVANGRSEF